MLQNGHWRSVAPKALTEAEGPDRSRRRASWGTTLLHADARFAQRSVAKLGVRVQQPLQICLECRSKS